MKSPQTNRTLQIIIAASVLLIAAIVIFYYATHSQQINSFDECVQAGNPIMESYPERCDAGDRVFTNPAQVIN